MGQTPDRGSSQVTEIGRERLDPSVLAAITLDDIAVGIRKLLEVTERQLPKGETPFIEFTDADPITAQRREVALDPPWFSLEIANDSDVELLVQVNNGAADPLRIRSGEAPKFDFDLPAIHTVFLRTVSSSARVRLFGTR